MIKQKSKLIKTADGTYTLYHDDYSEPMHSLSGAYEEALLKHVYPSNILNKKKDHIYVLDVGFGLGYNILALLTELHTRGYTGAVTVISLEKDRFSRDAMDCIYFNDMRDQYYKIIIDAYNCGFVVEGNTEIAVIFGDARDSIRNIPSVHFDAVFFDPFSPLKNPELWTVDFFSELYYVMDSLGVLTTYSSAGLARMAMIEAGFIVGEGPIVGRKKGGTIAAKENIIKPLGDDVLKQIRNNTGSIPFRDKGLKMKVKEIIKNRNLSMKKEMPVS